jgi:hypothetical protein
VDATKAVVSSELYVPLVQETVSLEIFCVVADAGFIELHTMATNAVKVIISFFIF